MLQPDIRRYFRQGTLCQFRVFEAIARLGSLTRAAEELHIAQPTASVQMRKLSATVGVQLFEQVGRRIYLTEAGHRVQAGCEAVFGALDELDRTLDDLRAVEGGHLRLAVGSAGKQVALRLLAGFVERYPKVDVAMDIRNCAALLARLSANQDDLYVFTAPIARENVVTQLLLHNPLIVLARDDHPLARARGIPFARLAEEPMLLREPGSGSRAIAETLFQRFGARCRIRLELSTDEAVKEAILAGFGVAIVSRFSLGLDPESPRLVCLDVEGFPVENQWHFAYPIGKQLSATARAFMDFAREEVAHLMPQ